MEGLVAGLPALIESGSGLTVVAIIYTDEIPQLQAGKPTSLSFGMTMKRQGVRTEASIHQSSHHRVIPTVVPMLLSGRNGGIPSTLSAQGSQGMPITVSGLVLCG